MPNNNQFHNPSIYAQQTIQNPTEQTVSGMNARPTELELLCSKNKLRKLGIYAQQTKLNKRCRA